MQSAVEWVGNKVYVGEPMRLNGHTEEDGGDGYGDGSANGHGACTLGVRNLMAGYTASVEQAHDPSRPLGRSER